MSGFFLGETPELQLGTSMLCRSRRQNDTARTMIITNSRNSLRTLAALTCVLLSPVAAAQDQGAPLPDPDGKSANMSKRVQVYILMGQSNMLGFGKINGGNGSLTHAINEKGKYPYLMDDSGAWTVRKDVRNVFVMGSGIGRMKVYKNEWMTITGKNIGPEIGIGHYVGNATDAPVLILKSCIGNRSLGYDLVPPGAEGREPPKSSGWYAGIQYDGDVANAKTVLANLRDYYPGAKGYTVAGFFWWQGDKDRYNADLANRYEENLVLMIKALRAEFNAPDANFVCATLGQTSKGAGGNEGKILEAQLAVDGKSRKYPKFKGNVASVYSKPYCQGGGSSGHYGGNAETYMGVGQAMGRAMAELLSKAVPGSAVRSLVDEDKLDSGLKTVLKLLVDNRLAQADKAVQPYLGGQTGKDAEQVGYAEKLNDYLTSMVTEAVEEMQAISDSGDVCQLKQALAKNKRFAGIAAYDTEQAECAAELGSETGIKELAVGKKFYAIVAKKESVKAASYFRLLANLRVENPDSFYVSKADEEIAAVNALVAKSIGEIRALGEIGDVYAKFTMIKEVKTKLAKIPAFDRANEEWNREYKEAETKRNYAAGKAYAAIFESLEDTNTKFKRIRASNNKIKSTRSRAKAVEKTSLYYMTKLKPLASKLEKFVDRYGDSYYGKGARTALDNYVKSERKTLKNPLAGKGK